MGYAFISYSSKDIDRANELRDLLKSKNIDCWMARYDIEQNFPKEIGQRIKGCACFLLVLTNNAQKSKWVSKEVALAIKYNKEMLPLQIENGLILNDAFDTYLADVHIEEVKKINDSDFGMSRILKKVEKFAGISVPVEEKVEIKAKPVKEKAIEPAKSKESDIVTVVDKYGWKYVGQMKDGMYHGKGIFYFPNGSKWYEGDWKNGIIHGKGTIYNPDGSKYYEGDLFDGKSHGKGTWYYSDGSIRYKGEFENGEPKDW